MAMIKCSECKKEISNKAQTCPNCGAPSKGGKGGLLNAKLGCGAGCLVLILLFILIGAIGNIGDTKKKAEIDKKEKAIVEQKKKDAIEAFIKVKDEKYIELTKFVESESWKEAQAIIAQFKRANLNEYKDLAEIDKKVRTGVALAGIKGTQPFEVEKLHGYYIELAKLNPDSKEYAAKLDELKVKVAEKKESERQLAIQQKQLEARKKRIETGFSGWDGSHRGLAAIIKESMNDPDSYEHVNTSYWDQGDHLIVLTEFRGKNAFGGVVKNWVKAKTSLDGSVLEIIEQGP
jgi:Na+-transporting methylmalonyl-CoA/oxaloacetate decarboxylase gamma subunit